jgi:hypothetical protein
LEASIPPYVEPYQYTPTVQPTVQEAAPAEAPYVEPYQPTPAAQPMTQEAAPAEAPVDLSKLNFSGLDNLYGMNFASDFGGGAMGGIYPDDPNTEYIAAPLSNKGNFTAQSGNAFVMGADQPVRLVDLNTNTVIFEGTGYDAAREATRLGQNLTDTMGRKAQYNIQTANPAGVYTTVANEKKNKSTLGEIANVAGTALPLAALAIPGLNVAAGKLLGSKILGSIALGATLGGAGAGLKGDNILKGAALGGLTAAGGALIPKIPAVGDLGNLAKPIGTGIGATVGGLATGQDLKNSLLGGVASGALAYAAPSIQDAFKGISQGPNVSAGGADTSVSTGSGPAPITTVTGNTSFSSPVSIGGGSPPQTKLAELEPPATIVSGSGSPFAAAFPIPASVLSGALPATPQPKPDQMSEEDIIKVTGALPGATPSVDLGRGLPPQVIDRIVQPVETLSPEEILVETRKSFTPPVNVDLSNVTRGGLNTATEPTLEEILVNARETLTPPVNVGTATGGTTPAEEPLIKVTGRQTTTTPGLIPGFETPMPDMAETAEEAEAKKKKLGLEEYLRIAGLLSGLIGGGGGGDTGQAGTYTRGGGGLNPIFSAKLPSAGGLGAIGANRTARPLGDQDWLTYGTRPELNFFDYAQAAPARPAPITRPIPNEPRGPAMYAPEVDKMRFARGGAAKGGLSYEELSPEEKNFVDYHRRSLLVNPYERDGNISSVVGAVNAVPEGEMLYPTYVHGKMMDPNSARDWALRSGIDFPVYPDAETALARERMIHDNIIEPETTRYARGEREFLQERAKGGSSKRTEFAVNGPGTGRSDDIPAVLSDGEYVIDAETVALLGDGSNKAGAKKLDELRVKVRKHKGQKLAKGRFSANAKKPEAYLSGGRV